MRSNDVDNPMRRERGDPMSGSGKKEEGMGQGWERDGEGEGKGKGKRRVASAQVLVEASRPERTLLSIVRSTRRRVAAARRRPPSAKRVKEEGKRSAPEHDQVRHQVRLVLHNPRSPLVDAVLPRLRVEEDGGTESGGHEVAEEGTGGDALRCERRGRRKTVGRGAEERGERWVEVRDRRSEGERTRRRRTGSAIDERKGEKETERKGRERTKQTSGNAIMTPHSAPPRMERYIEPGMEKA
jgi:hypothetical protein